jgi:hypothetical protein
MLKQIKKLVPMAGLVAPALAQEQIKLTAPTAFSGLGTLTVGGMVNQAISIVLILVTVVFFFILVIGGLKWITSGGDEKKVAAARAQITNALIGLAIVFAAWAIIKLIESLFGVSITQGFSIGSFQPTN